MEGPGTKGVNKTSDFILLANYSNLFLLDVLRGQRWPDTKDSRAFIATCVGEAHRNGAYPLQEL